MDGDRSLSDIVVGGSLVFASLAALLLYLYLVFSTPWPSNSLLFYLKLAGAAIVVLLYSTIGFLAYRVFLRGLRRYRTSAEGEEECCYNKPGSEDLEPGEGLAEDDIGE